MRKPLATLCLVVLSAVSLTAEEGGAERREQILRNRARMVAGTASTPGRVRSDAIVQSTSEDWIFIPAAGSLQGSFGTFFKSDVTILNHRDVPQRVSVLWIPIGEFGLDNEEVFLTIPANSFVAFDDFVGQTMGEQGLGSLEFMAVDAEDSLDLDAELDIYSRIWTPQPNSDRGSVSQNFDGVGLLHTTGPEPVHIIGLKQNASFRTNVGIMNANFEPATFMVNINGTNGNTSFPVTVPAYSMIQQGIPAGDWGPMHIEVTPPAEYGFLDVWIAYATTNDNGTGDGWVALGSRVREDF